MGFLENKKYLFLSLSIIFTCIIYGTRAVLLEPLILLFILWASCYYNRFKFRYILIICLSAFFLFFFILLLREGRLDTVDKQVVYGDVLYGNTFSDLRDFAIFLSNWDFNFLFGKTYLAGIISFIPRFISEFREEWAIGVVTTYFVGFDSNEHPGLRINPFGEMFINFGFPGVIILSFVLGYYLRKIDYGIKSNMTSAAPSFNKNYALLSHSYLLLCLINSSTFPLYYTFVILMFLFALVQFGVKKLGLSDKSDP
jgi:oligosaccharide repeat unit polymerase